MDVVGQVTADKLWVVDRSSARADSSTTRSALLIILFAEPQTETGKPDVVGLSGRLSVQCQAGLKVRQPATIYGFSEKFEVVNTAKTDFPQEFTPPEHGTIIDIAGNIICNLKLGEQT